MQIVRLNLKNPYFNRIAPGFYTVKNQKIEF